MKNLYKIAAVVAIIIVIFGVFSIFSSPVTVINQFLTWLQTSVFNMPGSAFQLPVPTP